MAELFKGFYAARCRSCGKSFAEWLISDGTSNDYPYCEKCADKRIAEFKDRQQSREGT